MKTKTKPANVVIVTRTYATESRVFNRGERVRASEPGLDVRWTVPDGTPESEWGSLWDDLEPPPQHAPPATVLELNIPPHRQVRCEVDVSKPTSWAPGSLGETFGRPPAFARTVLRKGQILDVLDDRVRANPGHFRWIEREVSFEDVERLEKLDRLERGEQAP